MRVEAAALAGPAPASNVEPQAHAREGARRAYLPGVVDGGRIRSLVGPAEGGTAAALVSLLRPPASAVVLTWAVIDGEVFSFPEQRCVLAPPCGWFRFDGFEVCFDEGLPLRVRSLSTTPHNEIEGRVEAMLRAGHSPVSMIGSLPVMGVGGFDAQL